MMQMGHFSLQKVQGLDFYKLLGTGGGDGYQWRPDFSTYAFLTVFADEIAANNFIEKSKIYKEYQSKSTSFSTVLLSPFAAHGEWSKKQPFILNEFQDHQPIAIITRATIKFRFLYKFWKLVPFVSETINDVEGPLFGKGIGEWPLIQQATFSIWRNKQVMIDFAYKSKLHKIAIENTRKLNWYSEEMFVRFNVINIQGTLIDL